MNTKETIIVNRSNGIGTAGFIFALLGLLLFWIPILSMILWGLGLLFSFIGLFKRPRGLAIAGFFISSIGAIILIVLVGGVLAVFTSLDSKGSDDYNKNSEVYDSHQTDVSVRDDADSINGAVFHQNKTTYTIEEDREIDKNQEIEIDSIGTVGEFFKTYEGFINDKYEIIVKLARDSTSLEGTYRYASQQAQLRLTGEIEKSGNFIVKEYDNNGQNTGVFEGTLANDIMKGTWSNPDGSKSYPFSCIRMK